MGDKRGGKEIVEAIGTVIAVVIMAVIGALIIGTLLASTVFSSITIINVTLISAQFGEFITGLLAFLAIIGTVVGVVWLVFYVKSLFDKRTGIQSMTA